MDHWDTFTLWRVFNYLLMVSLATSYEHFRRAEALHDMKFTRDKWKEHAQACIWNYWSYR